MNAAYHVRRATAGDATSLAGLVQEAHAVHAAALPAVFHPADAVVVTADELVARLGEPQQCWWVATDQSGVPIGYLHAEEQVVPASRHKQAARRLHVVATGVTARARGQGVARALLAAAREEAARRSLPEITLEVYSFNAAARRLYIAEGFQPVRELMACPQAAPPPPSHSPPRSSRSSC